MTTKRTRLFRYEVTAVDGFEEYEKAPVAVGDVIVDHWKANRNWEVHDFSRKRRTYVGSWTAKLLGELTAEEVAKVEASRSARAS